MGNISGYAGTWLVTPIVALVVLTSCSAEPNRSVVAAQVTTPTETTATERTTTAPPTTDVVTSPPTITLPTTTTTGVPPPTTIEAFSTDVPVLETPPPTWPPYTPLPGVAGVSALTNVFHPELENVAALAVKIDNHRNARPQWSLAFADVIFEENVESLTRFIAIFHSRLPAVIGPIRSARTSDLNILAAFNRPVLAWSGGNNYVTAAVQSAAWSGILVNIGALHDSAVLLARSERKAPHNLVVNPGCALEVAPSAGPARAPWTFDDAYVPVGEPDTGFAIGMDGVTVGWTWDAASGQYLRDQDGAPHLVTDGAHISATNVVMMSVVYIPSPADPRSPEAQTVGSGHVVVHRNGVAVAGTWSRATPTDAFNFVDAAGAPIPMASGTTFVELVRA